MERLCNIGVVLYNKSFYVGKADAEIAKELGLKINRIGGLTLPWDAFNGPERAWLCHIYILLHYNFCPLQPLVLYSFGIPDLVTGWAWLFSCATKVEGCSQGRQMDLIRAI